MQLEPINKLQNNIPFFTPFLYTYPAGIVDTVLFIEVSSFQRPFIRVSTTDETLRLMFSVDYLVAGAPWRCHLICKKLLNITLSLNNDHSDD